MMLRRQARVLRAAFVAGLDDRLRDDLQAALAARLAAHLPPGIVAGYHAVGSEIGLHHVDRITLWPRVVPASALTFHAGPPEPTTFAVSGLGAVPQPPADAPAAIPAVVLVPLLAVDGAGTRLGQGGGHYDRTFAALRARGPVFAVGVAWDCQLVDALPADPWDAPLDALATPTQWRDFAR